MITIVLTGCTFDQHVAENERLPVKKILQSIAQGEFFLSKRSLCQTFKVVKLFPKLTQMPALIKPLAADMIKRVARL